MIVTEISNKTSGPESFFSPWQPNVSHLHDTSTQAFSLSSGDQSQDAETGPFLQLFSLKLPRGVTFPLQSAPFLFEAIGLS